MKSFFLWLFFIFITSGVSYGQSWEDITPPFDECPAPRTDASMVYDSINRQLLVFGGVGEEGFFNDVWAFDMTTLRWKNLTPKNGDAPEPRYGANAVFDPRRWQMIMWGGRGKDFYNDVWVFLVGDNVWKKLNPSRPDPEPRFCAASVFDSGSDEMVAFGGFSVSGRMWDIWKLRPFSESWTNSTTSGGPQGRYRHVAAYNPLDSSMIVFGGRDRFPLDDIWSLDLKSGVWSDLSPVQRPEGRFSSCGVMDTGTGRLIVFGGNIGRYELTNETLIFNLASQRWTRANPSGFLPSEREGASAVYIEQDDSMIVFGGWNGGFLSDVWRLNGLSMLNR